MINISLIIVSYLLGSIPFGLLIAKIMGKGDIRKVGSGNIGATNVMRVGGLKVAGLVWILDMVKAMAAVLLGMYFIDGAFGAWCGFFAIVGHCYPIWLDFKGGKGNSSMFGALLAISPMSFVVLGIEWLLVAFTTGYSSLGALIGFAILPIMGLAIGGGMFWPFMFMALLCIWRHKPNIIKLWNGTESKIEWKWKK